MANFLMLLPGDRFPRLGAALDRQPVWINRYSAPGAMRLSIGTRSDHERFVAAVEEGRRG